MTEKAIQKIRLIYGLILSCLILVAGACLITACLAIYQSGEKPFSQESVALAFEGIALPVYLCLGGIAGGILLSLVLPLPAPTKKAIRDQRITLQQLLGRLDEGSLDAEAQKSLDNERALRKTLRTICIAVSVIFAVAAAIYACNPGNYTLENLNNDILAAALITLGSFALAFAICFACGLLASASVTRELNTVKELLKEAPKSSAPIKSAPVERNAKLLWSIRGAILLVGIVFVIIGILNGGAEDVLGKAIRICTECIGLG